MNLVEETALVILGAVKGLAKTASSPNKWRRYCQSVGLPLQELSWPANLDFQLHELENMMVHGIPLNDSAEAPRLPTAMDCEEQ